MLKDGLYSNEIISADDVNKTLTANTYEYHNKDKVKINTKIFKLLKSDEIVYFTAGNLINWHQLNIPRVPVITNSL